MAAKNSGRQLGTPELLSIELFAGCGGLTLACTQCRVEGAIRRRTGPDGDGDAVQKYARP